MTQTQQARGVKTSIRTDDSGRTYVNYRGTDFVSFDANTITLRSGGWLTATTKTRMNQASNQFDLGYSVFQKNFEWFVRLEGRNLEFVDGMTIVRP